MKKLMLFGLGVVASLSVLTSCKKDELAAPTVSFQNAKTSYEATSVTDTVFETTITVDAPAKIETIKIYKVTESGKSTEKLISSNFTSSTQHIFQYKFRAGKYEIEATDNENQTTSAFFTFTAFTPQAGEIVSYSTKIMGAQFNNAVGSFLSTSNGTIYSKTDAKTNSSLIDFVYSYRGGNYLAFIAAPSDALLDPTVNIKAESWTKYNSTKFKLSTLTSNDFDAITDDSNFTFGAQLTETNVLSLNVGNIVYFKTDAGKLGVFKVKAINEGTQGGDAVQKFQDGSIEIDVKVQK
jgi:hypothetical protein